MLQDIENLQECIGGCYYALEQDLQALGCGWPDFLWAVQVGCWP
jgi:hypothetical protein